MASNFVTKEDNHDYEHHHHHHHHHYHHHQQKPPSPRGMRRTWSSNSSSCDHGAAAGAAPKCVCAPPTHAGSFKCRLHRTTSHGHSPTSPTSIPPPPSVGSSRTPTVEAQ